MKGYLALRRIALVLAFMCGLLGIWFLWLRPTTLTIVVGPPNSAQHRYVDSIARLLRETKQPFRLKVRAVQGAEVASRMLDDGQADLAVVRSDDLAAKDARSLVIIHRRAVILVTRKDAEVSGLKDLGGRTIAVAMADSDSFTQMLGRILSHYEIDEEAIKLQEMPRDVVSAALVGKSIDGFIMVTNPASRLNRSLIAELTGNKNVEIVISGAPAHEALAYRFKELQTIELPEGVFGGNPSLPTEVIKTVAITYEIAGTSRLAERQASAITKALMDLRSRLRAGPSDSFFIETPPVDEARGIAVHGGTTAYVNSEVKTWFDIYGEFLWLGMFTIGLVGSGIAAVMSWAGWTGDAPSEVLASKLRHLAGRLEAASTTDEIDAIRGDFDDLVLAIMRDQGVPSLAQEGQVDPSPWLRTFDGLIARRRSMVADLDERSAMAKPETTG